MLRAALFDIDTGTLLAIILGAATVFGGAVALLGIWSRLQGWYLRTLGRRRDRYERLARLGTGAQRSFFEAVLGEPPAMSRSLEAEVSEYDADTEQEVQVKRTFRQHFFIDRDFYVQAVCDSEETVLAFSVTTRSERFNPTFCIPPGARPKRWWRRGHGPLCIKLGRTRFSHLWDRDQDYRPQIRASSGARTFTYTEALWGANPGYYQHYCFTASSAGVGAFDSLVDVRTKLGDDWVGGLAGGDVGTLSDDPEFRRFWAETAITTYTVLGPHLRPENYPTTFGPHGDEVRTLP